MLNKDQRDLCLVTDRALGYSDSVARYVIDLSREMTKRYRSVTIFSTNEKQIPKSEGDNVGDLTTEFKLPIYNSNCIYHFHLTFSVRKHTRMLVNRIGEFGKRSVVTFHVDPRYARLVGQGESIRYILDPIIKHNVPVYVFSNYSKSNFEREGVNNIWTITPGLDLGIYRQYNHRFQKINQVMFLASNPKKKFVNDCKNAKLLPIIKKQLGSYKIVRCINRSFDDYMIEMAKSKYYLAIGEYEHYGFAIIDSFNLGVVPIFVNSGGLTESVHNRGIPIYLKSGDLYAIQKKLEYNLDTISDNYCYSKLVHNLDIHGKQVEALYRSVVGL